MVPKIVFIIPYRNRELHKKFFLKHMKDHVLKDRDDYELYFVHQCCDRSFNRGAMKNIGFLAIKSKYPDNYRDITLIFNDVDTMPFEPDQMSYQTTQGVIKHFYGFTYALGGIFSITGSDFEKINGFPNFWAWGYEDNAIYNRALKEKIQIDRTQFYQILDENVIYFHHGYKRQVSKTQKKELLTHTKEGILEIYNLKYNFSEELINVEYFDIKGKHSHNSIEIEEWDLRNGLNPYPNLRKGTMSMVMNIP